MKLSAPNLFSFGIHSFDVKKESPASRNAGHALVSVLAAINTRMTSTVSPAASVMRRKPASAARPRVRAAVRLGRAAVSGRNDKRLQLLDGLLAEAGGQLRVVRGTVDGLAIGVQEVEQ